MRRHHLTSTLVLAGVAMLGACAEGVTAPDAPQFAAPAARQLEMEPAVIKLGYFSKSPVITMGLKHGFFAAENITLDTAQTASSPQIFRNLRDGQRDIILTQIDNVFNYRYNQSNPIGGTFEPVAFMGTDWGNGAALVTRKGITAVEELRGKTVAVDSPNSGFAFVLYGILRAHGLQKDVDYTVIVPKKADGTQDSGTPARFTRLQAGEFDATILNAGFQFRAEAAGFPVLGQIRDAADPFMGGSGVARRAWLDENQDLAIRFIRAYVAAENYVLDPANKPELIAQLTREANGNTLVANKTYDLLLREGEGLTPEASIDLKGLFETASLRASFGGFDTPQNLQYLTSPASGMYDLSYWRLATKANGWKE
ncbi:MAG TPA: ABC transporter substrate-binding protein [Gemmatimonadaceae bacterium]|nr:ABC transporter substrate-binding protein [Gemmatimonadaceae bacterium]